MIQFEFGNVGYVVDDEAYNKNKIVLPDGRVFEVGGWIGTDPPQPRHLTEVSHLFQGLPVEEIAENLDAVVAIDPFLSLEETRHPGCGAGTENACFALSVTAQGFTCLLISSHQIASYAGIRLGWRVNTDPVDGKAWCPKGVLNNSKRPQKES